MSDNSIEETTKNIKLYAQQEIRTNVARNMLDHMVSSEPSGNPAIIEKIHRVRRILFELSEFYCERTLEETEKGNAS
jgi:hypothetical protein